MVLTQDNVLQRSQGLSQFSETLDDSKSCFSIEDLDQVNNPAAGLQVQISRQVVRFDQKFLEHHSHRMGLLEHDTGLSDVRVILQLLPLQSRSYIQRSTSSPMSPHRMKHPFRLKHMTLPFPLNRLQMKTNQRTPPRAMQNSGLLRKMSHYLIQILNPLRRSVAPVYLCLVYGLNPLLI
jgi:hypothetical protein